MQASSVLGLRVGLSLLYPAGVRITGGCPGFHLGEEANYAPGDSAWRVITKRQLPGHPLGGKEHIS
jgi:hypothetical protein